MEEDFPDLPPIFAVYRYFLAADAMRRYTHDQLKDGQYWRALKVHPQVGYAVMFLMGPPGIGLAYYYSAMYVLIEAWRTLDYHDSKVDALLNAPFVDTLRRFRNATFHFQSDFVSEKWKAFLDAGEESSQWIQQLRDAFSEYFLRETTWADITGPIPQEIAARIKGKPVDKAMDIVYRWLRKHSS